MMHPYKGYYIKSSASNGRGYNGNQKTSGLHVIQLGYTQGTYLDLKKFSFVVGDKESKAKAFTKAKEYIDNLLNKKEADALNTP